MHMYILGSFHSDPKLEAIHMSSSRGTVEHTCASSLPRNDTQWLQRNSWSTEQPAQVTREWHWVRKANGARLPTKGLCACSMVENRLAVPRSYKGGGAGEKWMFLWKGHCEGVRDPWGWTDIGPFDVHINTRVVLSYRL